MSHHLLIFLFLKAFERVTSLFQTWFFLLLVWCLVKILDSWIIDSRVFLFVEESLISLKIFDSCCDGKWERISLLEFFIFFNQVDQVNSEYQLSHSSPTDSRSSLGINLYLVSDSSWPMSRRIQLDWVVSDSTDFLNPSYAFLS